MSKSTKNKSKLTNVKFHKTATALGYALVGLILLGAGVLLLGAGVWLFSIINWTTVQSLHSSHLALEYIKVLAWPIFFTLVLVVLRKDIRSLLNRLVKANLPGGFGGEFNPSQKQPTKDDIEEISDVNDVKEEIATEASLDEEAIFHNPEIRLVFERIYRNIFGTQFLALNFLSASKGPVRAEYMSHLYDRHKNAMSVSKYDSIHELMNYLLSFNLVEYKKMDDTYEILPAGKLFLRYMASEGLTSESKEY